MRVTVTHNKSKAEVVKIIDESADQLYKGVPGAPIKISDQHKQWEGDTMYFSFTGKMGFFSSSLKGFAHVTDADVTIDIELPAILKSFMPEENVKAQIETRVKGLLA